MGLQLEEAVDHLHAGALQVARPADIGFLVEARLQLDQRRHRLAGLGRLDQRLDDRAVVAGAIERLLDRHHRRVARRLAQELHHDVEALVGMMDDDVLLPDRGEAIAAEIADALGKARVVGREDEVGPLVDDELLRRSPSPSSPSSANTSSAATLELLDQETRADRRASRASTLRRMTLPRRRRFSALSIEPHQVFGLFLDLDLAVAQDAEHALPDHARSRGTAGRETGRSSARPGGSGAPCRAGG